MILTKFKHIIKKPSTH
ncbi:hypothetical protein D030_2023A, partial [Vibrio parahaemolyticus AQ3810]